MKNGVTRTSVATPQLIGLHASAPDEPDVASTPTPKQRQRTPTRVLQQLLGDYTQAELRAALIIAWARRSGITTAKLTSLAATAELLDPTSPRQVASAVGRLALASSQVNPSIKDLERSLESLTSLADRRAKGVVYTPDHIIDYLLDHGDRLRTERPPHPPSILDPACGVGGFLVRSARYLRTAYKIPLRTAFTRHVFGSDLDSASVATARAVIELYVMSEGERATRLTPNVHQCDALLTPTSEVSARFGQQAGFDLVVTNPPYVKLQNLDDSYRTALTGRFGPLATGAFSTALLFLLAGRSLTRSGGTCGMITQNNLYTSLAAENVRALLQQERALRRIVDFAHHQVFDNASAYTCLVFVGNGATDEFEFACLRSGADSARLSAASFSKIAHAELNSTKWRLAERVHLDNLRRVERLGTPLGRLARISVGFATLKDSVFLVTRDAAGAVARAEDGSSTTIESGIVRPALKVADITSQSDIEVLSTGVIFPYQKVGARYVPLDEATLRRAYPLAYAHLSRHRARLESRDKGRKSYPAWYAWGRGQGMDAPGPKLLTKTFDRGPHFYYDATDQVFCNGYSVTLRGANEHDRLLALQHILNSRVMHYFATLTSFQLEGGFQCYQKNFIERFGVPELNASLVAELTGVEPAVRDELLCELYGIHRDDIDAVLGPSQR